MPDRLLPRRVPRHLGDREVHLGEALAVLGDHRTASGRRRILAQLHRLRHRVHRQVVVRDLRHLVPVEPRRIADRLLQSRRRVAVGDDVEPVAVAAVLGHAPLVGREQDRAGRCAEALHLDEAQLAGGEVEAGDVVAQVLLGHVVDLAALRLLVLHDHAHGDGFGLEVRLEAPHLGRLALGVRQDEDAREPLDRLERERPLAIEFGPAALAAGQQLRVARLGLREPSLGARELLLHVGRGAADLLVRALEQLGERQLDVRADPLDLGEAILARLLEERRERVLVKPARRLGQAQRPRAARPADPRARSCRAGRAPGAGARRPRRSRPRRAARG